MSEELDMNSKNLFLDFLTMRRKNLHILRSQVPFNRLIPKKDKELAVHILGGRLKEVERMIRKINTKTIGEMIDKETFSHNLNVIQRNEAVRKKLGVGEKDV